MYKNIENKIKKIAYIHIMVDSSNFFSNLIYSSSFFILLITVDSDGFT